MVSDVGGKYSLCAFDRFGNDIAFECDKGNWENFDLLYGLSFDLCWFTLTTTLLQT